MTQGAKTEAKIIGLVEDSYIPVEAQRLLTHTLTLLARSLVCSLVHSLTHSLHSLAGMHARSLTHSLTHSTRSLACSLVRSLLTNSLTHPRERERERERERDSMHAFTFPQCLCQKLGPYARYILLNLYISSTL